MTVTDERPPPELDEEPPDEPDDTAPEQDDREERLRAGAQALGIPVGEARELLDYAEAEEAAWDEARLAHELDSATRAAREAQPPPPLRIITKGDTAGPYITGAMYDELLDESPLHYVKWSTFWDADRTDPEWLYEPIVARHRGHTIYAAHKIGKSLIALWVALQLTTRHPDTVVLYLDYEMGEDDLYERLTDMGAGPHTDLTRLRYALLPSIPTLDTRAGATELFNEVDKLQARFAGQHLAVVLDTTARALSGPENDSDTIRNFAHHTGIGLRQRRCTWVRLDHAGKDPTRGQRGTSAKGDDVDIIWRLAESETGYTLKCDAARVGWVPREVALHRRDNPLTFTIGDHSWPAGTKDAAALLERCAVPVDASSRRAHQMLAEHGEGVRNEVLLAALRYRREDEPI